MHPTSSDYFLLLLLRENPFSPISELARALDVSENTVRSRLARLKKIGLLRSEAKISDPVFGIRKISDAIAYPSYAKLGLVNCVVLMFGISGSESLEAITKILDMHPYTTYRSFGFSDAPMVYAQFALPQEGISLLSSLLEMLKELGFFSDHFLFSSSQHAVTRENLIYWDYKNQRWDYNIEALAFEEYDENQKVERAVKFSCLDLSLLRELTINARIRIADLVPHYGVDRTTLSRHMKFVRKELVQDFGILYDRSVFNFGNFRIIWGELKERMSPFHSLARKEFPFSSSYLQADGQFVWMVQAPEIVLNQLSMKLFSETTSVKQAILYPETGLRYYFYHLNFDCDAKQWKTSEAYILDDVLSVIGR